MKKTFTLSVPQPCHEKWEQFNPTTLGGFCSSCQKEVVDFTSWDEDAIKSYFKNRDVKTCGRFLTTQLKGYALPEIHSQTFPWVPVSLLSLTLLFSTQGAEAHQLKKAQTEIKDSGNEVRTLGLTSMVMEVQGIVRFHTDQSPLPGVNVAVKGTTLSTVTDEFGKFSMVIPNPKPTDSLQFSFVGLLTESHSIYESENLSVYMKEDFTLLGETVIMGGVCARRFGFRNLWWRIKGLFSKKLSH
jgi:hypothetical protein